MNHLGLFEGIGGFSIAAHWMGWNTVAWCEINPFAQKVLKYHFPNAIGHEDITKTDFSVYRNRVDLITGGFPCQPYSMAGKRKGKDDDRHLWPQMCRAIREIAPRYIVGENVLGLVNWNGGLVFDEVCADLEAEGYEVAPVVIPAAAVNAPHGRDRVWFVAYCNSRRLERSIEVGWNCINVERKSKFGNATNPDSDGQHQRNGEHEINASQGGVNALDDLNANDERRNASDTECLRGRQNFRQRESRFNDQTCSPNNWDNFPTQSPICGGDDGLPGQLDGITFSKWRNESIKAYGNAIVPQVAFEIFKAIQLYEKGL